MSKISKTEGDFRIMFFSESALHLLALYVVKFERCSSKKRYRSFAEVNFAKQIRLR